MPNQRIRNERGMQLLERAEPELERREFQRVKVPLDGRLMLSDRSEFHCQVSDVSPGSVCFLTDAAGRIGERVIAYIEHIGRLDGRVSRITPGGFALKLNTPLIKKQKLSSQLRWLADLYGRKRA